MCSLKSVSASGVTDQKEVLVELPEPVVEEGFFEEVVQRALETVPNLARVEERNSAYRRW